MAHQAIISTISTCLPINPFLGLQHEILSDKLLVQGFPAIFQEPVQRRLGVFIHDAIGRDQAGG
jgi:hypothetical protein